MKKKKEGQAVIFLVISMIIILALIYLFLPSRLASQEQQSDPLTQFVTSCLHQAGTDAIKHVAATGGTAQQNEPAQVPTIQEIEKAVAKQTERLLPRCYDGFKALSQQGIQMQAEPPAITALISQDSVYLTLKQTIAMTQNGKTMTSGHFVTEITASLKESIDAARSLQQHKEEIDITSLIQNNINATFLTTDKSYAIIEFPINGVPEPGRWWVQTQ